GFAFGSGPRAVSQNEQHCRGYWNEQGGERRVERRRSWYRVTFREGPRGGRIVDVRAEANENAGHVRGVCSRPAALEQASGQLASEPEQHCGRERACKDPEGRSLERVRAVASRDRGTGRPVLGAHAALRTAMRASVSTSSCSIGERRCWTRKER